MSHLGAADTFASLSFVFHFAVGTLCLSDVSNAKANVSVLLAFILYFNLWHLVFVPCLVGPSLWEDFFYVPFFFSPNNFIFYI